MEPLKKELKTTKQYRVMIRSELITKIDDWIDQIHDSSPGVKVNRLQILNWILEKENLVLNELQLSDISNKHYDEVSHTKWALKKLIEAQKGGRNLKLEDILKKKRPQTKRGRKKKNSTLIKSSISELSEEKNQ